MADSLGNVSVGILADTSNFEHGMHAALQQLNAFSSQASKLTLVGDAIRKNLVPVAASIVAAFGAKTALTAFADSDLPGAQEFKAALDESKKSLQNLAAAVGEYLAPAAKWAAELIKKIADPLADLVRRFTAFSRSAGAFLEALGANILKAFAPLLPTVTAAIDAIRGLFDGPAHDWAKDVEWFRDKWNDTWGAILEYTAPILVAAANALEAALAATAEIASAVFGKIKALAGDLADWVGSKIPAGAAEAGNAFEGLGDKIQSSIVSALSAAEFAFKNWREVALAAWTAVELGAVKAFESIKHFGDDLWKNLSVISDNFVAAFKYAGEEIGKIFDSLYESIVDNALVAAKRLAWILNNPLYTVAGLRAAPETFAAVLRGQSGEFTSPDFSGVGGALPAFQPLPGFTRKPSDTEQGLRSALNGLTGGLAGKFADFMKGPLGDVQAFIDRIKQGLPNVTATPVPPGPGSSKIGASSQGTFNPNALGGLSADNWARRTAEATEEIAKNTRPLRTPARMQGMGF